MIENIAGILIRGRCFKERTALKFFLKKDEKADDRISILYGKNGSGKSTISDGFSALVSDEIEDLEVSLFDNNDSIVTESISDNIHVFNEKYIDNNIKINDDGLDTIVLFGNQVNLQEQIDTYELQKNEMDKKLKDLQEKCALYNQNNNPLSPFYHWEHIKNSLRAPGGWAERDAKIKNNKKSSSVTDVITNEICTLDVHHTLNELKQEFNKIETILDKISNTEIDNPLEIKTVDIDKDFDIKVCGLLNKNIERPILTEREQTILYLIENGNQHYAEAAKKTLENPVDEVCPYCYQTITKDYKKELLVSINRILNKDVDIHTNELDNIYPPILESDRVYSSLDSELYEDINKTITECNEIWNHYSELIMQKKRNIYKPILCENLGLSAMITKLNVLLTRLEEKRKEFIDASTKSKKLKQELIEINKKIAHEQIKSVYKDFIKQQKEKTELETTLNKAYEDFNNLSQYLAELHQKSSDTQLAIRNINNALDYVFFNHGRLSIEFHNDKYYLKSNGQNVQPKKVSIGERNIIALCYFFTQIVSNQDINKLYENEQLIIIDDPISSFDFENKIGVISLLRYEMKKIISGNNNSKIMIMSHDLSTVFDLMKAADEVCSYTKSQAKICNTDFARLELSNGLLTQFQNKRSEYEKLLVDIYNFALNPSNDSSINIGNSMRKVLEAFSTFNYKKGIIEVSTEPNISKLLGEHSTYFDSLMYRLVLNNESHFEEKVYTLYDNDNFYDYISDDEKQRTAKDILCFLYILNPEHIKAYIGTKSKAIENIEKWCEEIPTNDKFNMKVQENNKEISKKRIVRLYYMPVSAGMGTDISDGSVSYEEYYTDNENCDFALRISGNSMEPDIPDKSIVLIRKCEEFPSGKIGVFYYDGNTYCKKLQKEDTATYLVSLNKDYGPIQVDTEKRLDLYGEVIEVVVNI